MENYILPEPLSLLNSIILGIGIHGIGIFTIKYFFKYQFENSFLKRSKFIFGYLIGYNLLVSIFYFFSIFTDQILFLFIITTIIVYFCALKVIGDYFNLPKKFSEYLFFNNKNNRLVYLILFGFLLLSLGPITNADSLDYHVGVAIKTLLNEKFTTEITWNTSTNASSGEVFIAFAIFNGAEQLASITNFFAILSIAFIILLFKSKFDQNTKFIVLLALSSPAIISLVSTAKPQLIFIASNFLSFAIITEKNRLNYKSLTLPIFLIANAFVAKFSFIFSSSLVFLLICLKFYKNYTYIIFMSLIVSCLTILPHFYFKYTAYGTNLFEFLRYPVPINVNGYHGFYEHLKGGGPVHFPSNILHPLKLKYFNEGLGIFFIILIPFIKNIIKKNFIQFILIVLFFLPLFLMTRTMSRYFIEMMLFLSLLISISESELKINIFSKLFIYFQYSICLLVIIIYGVIFSYGSFNNKSKDQINSIFTYEYLIFKWANNVLPKNSILLSYPRSISLSKHETYSLDFTRFTNGDRIHFWNIIKEKKPEYILSYSEIKKTSCIGDLFKYKKNVGFSTSRNFFQKKESHDGYIYKFNYKNLPNCIIK